MQRKLGNAELKEYFRTIDHMGWYVLSWKMKCVYYVHDRLGLKPFYKDDLIMPDDEQAYILIDLTRRASDVITQLLYHFNKPEYLVFEKPPSLEYDQMYGFSFTFRPEIEDRILRELEIK